jgi:hypothetical protein
MCQLSISFFTLISFSEYVENIVAQLSKTSLSSFVFFLGLVIYNPHRTLVLKVRMYLPRRQSPSLLSPSLLVIEWGCSLWQYGQSFTTTQRSPRTALAIFSSIIFLFYRDLNIFLMRFIPAIFLFVSHSGVSKR